jgi:hypothetical protein
MPRQHLSLTTICPHQVLSLLAVFVLLLSDLARSDPRRGRGKVSQSFKQQNEEMEEGGGRGSKREGKREFK